MKPLNIAIDGTVGSGKSSLAKALAKELDIMFFDTGALYRAFACEFIAKKFDESVINEKFVENFAKKLNFEVFFEENVEHIKINGVDYTQDLRHSETSRLSAILSPYSSIQNKVKEIQREFAKNNSCVMEGRDVGFDVLPNADFKFFLTADENVRANRRLAELKKSGKNISFEEVLKDLKKRDYMDINRKVAPLKMADDAILIDNSKLNLEKTLEKCLKIIKKSQKN